MTGILNLLASGKPPAAAVTAYQIERSLRFNSSDSAYLSWTPPVAGNRKTWTWSGWIKRTNFATTNILFSALNTGQSTFRCEFDATSNKLYFRNFISDTPNLNLITTQVFRDSSAWYHLVCAVDTTQATASDRVKLYINGVQITSFDTATYPSQNYDTWVNATTVHNIGSEIGAYGWFNGYIADVHFIDGQQLTPAAFGATSATTGVWTPSAYTGTYGTNGFRLPFSDNSSALNLGCNTAQTGDELWPYTTLHLSGNPANTSGYNCFSDKSGQNNGNGFPITVNGDTRSSSFSPYGTSWSAYFDGASDYIQYTNSDFSVSTGDFTAEWWMYVTSDKSQVGIMTAASNPNLTIGYGSGSANARQVYVEWGGSGAYIGSMSNYANVWVHICVMRSSGTVYTFQNGTLLSSVSKSAALGSTANMVIGTNSGDIAAQSFPGYLSNVRFSKVAVYSTSGFTPSTSPLTRTSQGATNVQFLTLQSNRFLDSNGVNTPASSPLTITKNGDVTVASFSPFLETDTTSGSGYFDGNGDFLATPTTGQFATTGNFTVSFWFYTLSSNQQVILGNHANTSTTSGNWMVTVENGTFGYYINGGGGAAQIYSAANTFVPGQWYFVSFSRSGNTVTAYLNGATVGSITKTDTFGNASQTVHIGQRPYAGSPVSVVGYIADVRFVDGTAIAGTTVPTTPVTAISGTQLLTLQDRANYNNSGFQDSSQFNHVITRNGNATQGTFSPFSQTGWGNYFDGSVDSLSLASNAAFAYGTSDFTWEVWVFPTASTWTSGSGNFYIIEHATNGGTLFYYQNRIAYYNPTTGTGSALYTSGGTVAPNQWSHIAVSRESGTTRIYVNGQLSTSGSDANNYAAQAVTIGRSGAGTQEYFGYMSNVRIVKGRAVYTSAFTPPTTPLTRTTGGTNPPQGTECSLLTCQSNRFLDSNGVNIPASSPLTITVNGNTSVQAFSPFTPSASWSAAAYGGSGYFEGSGDYLTVANNDALNLGNSDFTIEGWFFSGASFGGLFAKRGSNTIAGIAAYTDGTKIQYLCAIGGSWAVNMLGTANWVFNQWNHFAFVRSGSTFTSYINGVVSATATNSGTIDTNTGGFAIGATAADGAGLATSPFYLGSMRVVKGTAVYTAAFTPPSGPLTAIPGTSLLLNFTNAGIVDYTGKNVLETLGNASNVTALKKSLISAKGSLYFDGTGDSVNVPSSNSINFGSGNWTIEFWMYTANVSTRQDILDRRATATVTGWMLWMNGTAARLAFYTSFGWPFITSNTDIIANTWTHVAVVRNGNSFKMYQNGVEVASGTNASAMPDDNTYLRIGTSVENANYYNGYIQDLRITKYARYTGTFTPPVRTFAHNVLDIGHKQWTPVNFSVASGAGNDSLVDTPTPYGIDAPVAGSYATFDATSSSVTLSNGNLTLTGVAGAGYNKANTTTAVSSGKWYFEATLVSAGTDTSIGISQGNSSSTYPGQEATSYAYVLEKGQKFNGNSPAAYAASLAAGDVFMCAFDLDNNKLFFGKNGTWFASSNPATGANPAFTLTAGTYRAVGRPYGTNTATFNFGASTFAYTPPTGFAGLQDFVSGGVVRGNYATLNPINNSGGTFTNGNLDWTTPATDQRMALSSMSVSGISKWYCEFTMGSKTGSYWSVGIFGNSTAWNPRLQYRSDGARWVDSTQQAGNWSSFTQNDIIGIAFDGPTGTATFYKNGVSQGTMTVTDLTVLQYFACTSDGSGGTMNYTVNFGQRPFNYTAPSGFKALCTQNLSTPSIVKSNTAFDALVWSGDGVNNRKLTTNFSPDLFWVKARNSAAYHSINDSVRGANAILQTNTTSAEQVNSNGYVTTFAADGVNITNGSDINASGTNYVGWAWDAGTTTVTNTAGTISAQVRANPTTGFSIVSYTGVVGGNSVGHGLGVAPKFIIVKGRTTSAWIVYTQMTGVNAYLYLHTSGASVSDAGIWSGTGSGVTSSTFGVRGASDNGLTGVNLIAYCFAEVPGFSAFGSYTGNGSTDGPFVYTGFRPAWIMIKRSDNTENWNLYDTKRNSYNVADSELYPNLSNSEGTYADRDFLSNGFKIRNTNIGRNASGSTYIYAAFAENPFKYSLAR